MSTCPHIVTDIEGTSHCRLGESTGAEVARLQEVIARQNQRNAEGLVLLKQHAAAMARLRADVKELCTELNNAAHLADTHGLDVTCSNWLDIIAKHTKECRT